jgi:hypothetical protein
MASNEISAISIFNDAASREIGEGKPSQAMCLVLGDFPGSGALVSVDGRVCILTTGHLKDPKSVCFMVAEETAEEIRVDSKKFLVTAFFSMQNELHSTAAQHDLQILLVDGNPENHIKPLELTSEIDSAQPISGYGFGSLVAEDCRGHLSVGAPAEYKLDESEGVKRRGLLPAKVTFQNYEVNPIASRGDKVSLFYQKFTPQISVTEINPSTGRQDGIILITTTYNPETLETHIGGGFSGGPVLQNDKIVGIIQGGSLQSEEVSIPAEQRWSVYNFLSMWGLYLAGQKLPILQKTAPFAYAPMIIPSIGYMLGWLGYKHLSTPLRLCIFNSAAFAALNIYLVGKKLYARSQHALRGAHNLSLVHMTPEIIQWVQSKLAESTRELATAS